MLLAVPSAPMLHAVNRLALLVLLPALAAADAPRRTLSVAAAANLKPALDEIARAFEADRRDVDVVAAYGASGAVYAQISSGAPFDLFMSADREYPQKLVQAGLGTDETVYAIGKLVVFVPKGATVDVEREGLGALAAPSVRRLAIANPAVAPYGRAAVAALRAAGIYERVEGKLVKGESVSQAAQFAHSGAADAALVPLALALTPELASAGRFVPIPAGGHPPLEQSAVVLAGAKAPDLARALLAFVRGEKGRAILARFGYDLP